jgi:4-amino-4-deoxy-L-arabinose transferase-like glycosyltransferase
MQSPSEQTSTPRARLLAELALWLLLALFTFQGLDRPFGNGDEVRHAQTLREMMQSGDYLTMRWQGVPSFTRPATQYWLAAIFAGAIDGEVGMRLSSAACSFASLVLLWWLARELGLRRDAAALALILCAGAASFHGYSRSLLSEPPLVVAVLGALYGSLLAQRARHGLIVAGACLGAAVAIKSFAAAPPALLLLPWLVSAARRHGDRRSLVLAAATGLGLALPFYAINVALHGSAFLHEHLGFNVLRRATGEINVSRYAWHLYLEHLYVRDGLPTLTWFAAGTLGAAWLARARRDRPLLIVASFGLGYFVLMSALGTRLPHYILAVYPVAALGAAAVYDRLSARAYAARGAFVGTVAVLGACALLLIGLRMPGADPMLMQTAAGRVLGSVARQLARPDERVYAYEWYGQALGFYAQRPLTLLTAQPDRFRAIDVAHLKLAGAAKLVPPLPAPAGSEILIAARKPDLAAARWLEVEQALAFSEGVFLVRARIVDPLARALPAAAVP